MKQWTTWQMASVLALLGALILRQPLAAAVLVIDGQFSDWIGQPHVNDPPGDGPNPNVDTLSFYWGNNPGEEAIYWMMERTAPQSGNPRVFYFVYLDTDNDGAYTSAQDRMVRVSYDPRQNTSNVIVTVYSGTGAQISQESGDWGDSAAEGGRRVEWRASFADLGIDAHQTVNMLAAAGATQNPGNVDLVPNSGDITWTPIPALGWPGLILLVGGVILWAWRTQGNPWPGRAV